MIWVKPGRFQTPTTLWWLNTITVSLPRWKIGRLEVEGPGCVRGISPQRVLATTSWNTLTGFTWAAITATVPLSADAMYRSHRKSTRPDAGRSTRPDAGRPGFPGTDQSRRSGSSSVRIGRRSSPWVPRRVRGLRCPCWGSRGAWLTWGPWTWRCRRPMVPLWRTASMRPFNSTSERWLASRPELSVVSWPAGGPPTTGWNI